MIRRRVQNITVFLQLFSGKIRKYQIRVLGRGIYSNGRSNIEPGKRMANQLKSGRKA